jgi:hypothetical protein
VKSTMGIAQLIGLMVVLLLAVTCSAPQATPTLTPVLLVPTGPAAAPTQTQVSPIVPPKLTESPTAAPTVTLTSTPMPVSEIVWTGKGPEGQTIFALAIDPSTSTTLYAGTSGRGVLKSTDGGGNWTAVNAGLTNSYVEALAIDPSTPTTLYAGTRGGVFKSTDGGVTEARSTLD